MKIVICGSMSASQEMIEIKKSLDRVGHEAIFPKGAELYVSGQKKSDNQNDKIENKVKNDLIRDFYFAIEKADAVIIANFDKNGINNYIGGNTFLEAGFAHVLNKKLYFVNDIPEMIYREELIAFQPIILNGDLSKIK